MTKKRRSRLWVSPCLLVPVLECLLVLECLVPAPECLLALALVPLLKETTKTRSPCLPVPALECLPELALLVRAWVPDPVLRAHALLRERRSRAPRECLLVLAPECLPARDLLARAKKSPELPVPDRACLVLVREWLVPA